MERKESVKYRNKKYRTSNGFYTFEKCKTCDFTRREGKTEITGKFQCFPCSMKEGENE